MDSPLTLAELSRLRKAIQQRDRLLSQSSPTSAVDLRISRALSNLKLYLPVQTQLGAVLTDWETSDAAKKAQIIIWLRQNLLDDTSSQDSPPPSAIPPSSTFVHPPPPPALPSRTGSITSRPVSLAGTPPIPASARVTPVQAPSNANNAYPPREIHTQASLKPPTPPPKERVSGITHESLMRRHTLAGRPEPLRQPNAPATTRFDASSTSLYPNTFSGFNSSQHNVVSPNNFDAPDSTRRFGSQRSQPTPPSHSHTPNLPGSRYDSNQYHTPPSSNQSSQPSSEFVQGHTNPYGPFIPGPQATLSTHNQQFIEAWSKLQAQQAQHNSMLLQQLTQAQQQPNTAQILAAAQQQQAQIQANFLQQLQAQQAASSNTTTAQLLANLQQQQQAQTNQIMSILQQNASSFNSNPSQPNQQILDLLSQMQLGGTPGVDWASLASGSGMDPTTLMSMMMGGMDPTNLVMQGAGFMFG
ncbi:hypothetical protein RSOLAG22IIIB_09159 [Rhizoctonia solani]|uniref:Uncharacterized protein n=1 Tax=Rhizoctonia solani TaxID=456999 RepID=A0A0K6FX25_9AGAM|nr:hypothetical protein RSOLAG22IIIB_09159 [Rhizoctonia solani]